MEHSGHKGGDRDRTELLRGHEDRHFRDQDGSAVSELGRLVSGVQPQVEVCLKSPGVHFSQIVTGDSVSPCCSILGLLQGGQYLLKKKEFTHSGNIKHKNT